MSAMLASFVSTLGWALIHFVWQGLIVGIIAAIALVLLRDARPQTRYAVSCAALAVCLLLPVAGVWSGIGGGATGTSAPAPEASGSAAIFTQPAIGQLASVRSTLQDQLAIIVALWSVVAGLLALRMALGVTWISRIARARSTAGAPDWQLRLDRLAAAFGMSRKIQLRIVDSFDTPVAAGWWRPVVLVPAALIARIPTDLLEALLAHELAHIRRHDYLVNMIQSAIESLLFYHPVVWWLSRQIRIEREQIADALAATALGEPRRLAVALHQLAQFQFDTNATSMTQFASPANGGNLMSRIQRLIKPNQHSMNWRMALPLAGLTAACVTLTAFCLTVYANDRAPETQKQSVAAKTQAAVTRIAALTSTNTVRMVRGSDTSGSRQDGYALIRENSEGITMTGDHHDLPAIKAMRKTVRGDFLWVRRGEKTYVVTDPVIVAKAIEAWEPAEAVGAQMEQVGERMEIPSEKMEEIGRRMEAISENRPNEAAMEETSEKMQALGMQQEAIGEQMEAIGSQIEHSRLADMEELGRQMATLAEQMEPLSQEMATLSEVMEKYGSEMEIALEPMEELAREMERASMPMEALGEEMELLGAQMEAITSEADRKVKALIDEALRSGRAVTAEATSQ